MTLFDAASSVLAIQSRFRQLDALAHPAPAAATAASPASAPASASANSATAAAFAEVLEALAAGGAAGSTDAARTSAAGTVGALGTLSAYSGAAGLLSSGSSDLLSSDASLTGLLQLLALMSRSAAPTSAAAPAVAGAPGAGAGGAVSPAVPASYSYDPAGASTTAQRLVDAALSQLGTTQDCTDLVQNSLAAIGMTTRRDAGGYDYGPQGFNGFGTVVTDGSIRPGDIMERDGHVAIFLGYQDGQPTAIHGGFNGDQTVVSHVDADPAGYSTIVRLS